MPHVRQRESGRWQIAFREAGRTRWRLLGSEVVTRADADLAAKIMAGDIAATPTAAVATGLAKLHESLDAWLEAKRERKRAASTLAAYKHHADLAKKDSRLKANPKLRDVSPEAIEAFLRTRERATSAAMATKIRTTLNGFFGWTVKKKLLRLSPMPAVDWEPTEEDEPRGEKSPCPRPVLADHLWKLHADLSASCPVSRRRQGGYERHRDAGEVHARRLYSAVLRVLWGFGVRVVEVCRWLPDVDTQLDERDAEGQALIPAVRVRAPKNKGGRRWVSIPRGLVRLFRRWAAAARARGPRVPVFHTGEGENARVALDSFRGRWLEKHPDHRPASFHAFRHTMASRGDAAGLDEKLLSRGLLGHDQVSTTERYTHRSLERLREAQESLATFERAERARKRAKGAKGAKDAKGPGDRS